METVSIRQGGKNLALMISLLPLAIFSVLSADSSPLHSLSIILVSVVSCVIFEALSQKLLKQAVQIKDLSAVCCGLELALLLPESVLLWQVVPGALAAVVLAKVFFGGNGNYVFTPALIGRAFMYISFKASFSDGRWLFPSGSEGQAVWVLALITLAFLYLVFMKVISPETSASFTAVFIILCALFYAITKLPILTNTAETVSSGAVLFMAVFIITDTTTEPPVLLAKILYASITAILSFVLIIFGKNEDGAMFAILIMNALAPYFISNKKRKPEEKEGGTK